MQTAFKIFKDYYRSKSSVPFFVLLAICGIFNSQVSTLRAEELHAYPGSLVFNAVQGHSLSDTRSIFIFSLQGTVINWNQSKSVSWLTPNLSSGVTSTDTIL